MKNVLKPAVLALAFSVPALSVTLPVIAQTKQADVRIDPALPKDLFLKAPPALPATGAPALLPPEAKKAVKVGDTVTLAGRVGGSKAPFVSGRSILTLVGDDLPACSDNPDDHCKVPWDYCCESKADIVKHSATVQVVDDKGKTLRVDLKGQNGIKELSDLIVVGKVAQVNDKVLIVNATGIYVNPSLPHGFFLASKPANAKSVEDVKASAKIGETVSITGRIGGAAEPFAADRASFTVVGPGLASCKDDSASACKTPWDYCRHGKDETIKHVATIQVVDEQGNPLAMNLRGRGGMAELSTVTVVGKVTQADGNTLVISASGIHVHLDNAKSK